jgi:UDP-N-acetylmuramate dehydrogenase
MNAGGRFGQFADVVESIRLLTAEGSIEQRAKQDMGFAYRTSSVADAVVLDATLRLEREGAQRILSRFRDNWSYKKRTQPLAAHSAGCMFKNPIGQSAGQLIDDAGLKGQRVGKASVSRRHANFLVAENGATASEVLQLAEHVRRRVQESTGTLLEYEIDVWR